MKKHVSALSGALFLILSSVGSAAGQVEEADTSRVVELRPVLVNVLRSPFLVTEAPFAVAANTEDEITVTVMAPDMVTRCPTLRSVRS